MRVVFGSIGCLVAHEKSVWDNMRSLVPIGSLGAHATWKVCVHGMSWFAWEIFEHMGRSGAHATMEVWVTWKFWSLGTLGHSLGT